MEDRNKKPTTGDGNQRISVRPGNFTPPADVRPEKRNVQGGNQGGNHQGNNGEGGHHGGSKNRNRHRNRNRHKDNRPREDRPQNENAAPRTEQQKPQHSQATGPRDNNANNNRNNKNHRNSRHNNKGQHNTMQEAKPQNAAFSNSLQRELDEEFQTPTLSPITDMGARKREAVELVLDSEEFAVDIATASYLTEDIPCGFPAPDGKAVEVVGVRFREAGRVYFFAPGDLTPPIGTRVIVDTARGPEIGNVVMLRRKIAEKDVVQPLRSVLRVATPADIAHDKENHAKEAEALRVCERKIAIHKLDMHLIDAQYAFDNSKLLFYFTSEGRVDFRELVHDLAGHFHTRIELRQIGIRDEARLIGGLGMCGRPFCCATYLSDFGQVSVKMAKEQGLSINASKISGCCGRLMCCLRYEHETYVAEAKLTPKKDMIVQTPDGNGVVVDSVPLAGTVRVRLDAAPEETPKTYHRDALTVIGKANKAPQQKKQNEAENENA